MEIKGIMYLSIALLTFSFTHISDKIGMNKGVDPSVFSFFRIFFGLCFVAIVWFSLKKKKSLKFEKKYIKHFFIIGSLASGLAVILSVNALNYTTATNRGIMQGMYTGATLLFAYFILHERLPKLFYPVFLSMIVGLVMLTTEGFLQLPNKGDWILFLTIPIIGFCNAYAKRTMRKIKSLTVTFGRYIFGALFLLLILPFFGLDNIGTLQNGILWVIISGILSGVRVITFYKGMELEGPTIAATFLSIAPAFTAISEFIFLEERFNMLQILGIIIVLATALLLTRIKAKYKMANFKFIEEL